MSDTNSIHLRGRIASKIFFSSAAGDPNRKTDRAWFRLATTRKADRSLKRSDPARRTNFIEVVCWGAIAKNLAQYCATGDEISIDNGELIVEQTEVRNAQGPVLSDGKTVYTTNTYINVGPTAELHFGQKAGRNQVTNHAAATVGSLGGAQSILAAIQLALQTPKEPVIPSLPPTDLAVNSAAEVPAPAFPNAGEVTTSPFDDNA